MWYIYIKYIICMVFIHTRVYIYIHTYKFICIYSKTRKFVVHYVTGILRFDARAVTFSLNVKILTCRLKKNLTNLEIKIYPVKIVPQS